MMRGLPFWLSMLIIVTFWAIFFGALVKYGAHLRLGGLQRMFYALLCALVAWVVVAMFMKVIVVFFN